MRKNENATGTYAHVRRLPTDAAQKRTVTGSAHPRKKSRGGSDRQKVRTGGIHLSASTMPGSCTQGQTITKSSGDGSSARSYPGIRGSTGGDLVSILALIGLARKAGKLIIGEQAVRKGLKLSQVQLLILAQDSSNRTKRYFTAYAKAKAIPLIELSTKTGLGKQLGRQEIAILALIDRSLANAVLRKTGNVES